MPLFDNRASRLLKASADTFLVIVCLAALSVALPYFQPGDPALALAGDRASIEDLARIRGQFCLDKGFGGRLVCFLRELPAPHTVMTLSGASVASVLVKAYLPSLWLAFSALALVGFLGAGGGLLVYLAASDRLRRYSGSFMSFILTLPVFLVAVGFLFVFYFRWNLLPPGGFFSPLCLVMPAVALGMRSAARVYFFTLDFLDTESGGPLIRALVSRGYSMPRIVFLHLGRRMTLPLSGVLLSDFSSFLAGAVVVEEIFAFPGIGRVIFQAIQRMDLRLLGFLIFYVGLLIHILNISAERLLARGSGEGVDA